MINTELPSYWVVESSNGPSKDQHCRRTIADNATIQSDFIGASTQDCQKWALEKQSQDKAVEQDIFVIADERSTRDDTIMVTYYARTAWDFGGPERVPKESNKWYDFRVPYTEAETVKVAMHYVNPDVCYPIFFGRKEEMTDEHGVFNATKAFELAGKGG